MVLFYIGLTLVLTGLYIYLIIYLLDIWESYPDYVEQSEIDLTIGLSILIPARNESANILNCLTSLITSAEGLTNRIEILVIDDHSEDNTYELASGLGQPLIKVYKLQEWLGDRPINAYKKMALALGLEKAQEDYILQVDADVTVPKSYLHTLLKALTKEQPDLIAAPVLLEGESRLQIFQTLDMMGMMAVTAAGIYSGHWHIANGANLLYKKELVQYEDSATASGDDVITIQKFAAEGRKIIFLKNLSATVLTAALPDLASFYKQRIRWATKNKFQSSFSMKLMMAIPFLNCLLLLLHPIIAIWMGSIAWILLAFHLMCKLLIDYLYLYALATYFGKSQALRSYWYSSIAHILYIACVGVASLIVKKYEWKGRRVS